MVHVVSAAEVGVRRPCVSVGVKGEGFETWGRSREQDRKREKEKKGGGGLLRDKERSNRLG